ncbi:hypothetical protein P3S68_002390 [Capsicum galapagoense]
MESQRKIVNGQKHAIDLLVGSLHVVLFFYRMQSSNRIQRCIIHKDFEWVHWVIEWWSTLVVNSSHPSNGESPATATSDQSGDLSLDVKSNVVQKKDRKRFNFLSWSDLSNRKAPAVLLVFPWKLLLQCDQEVQVQAVETAPCRNVRVGKQRLREARIVGLCLGTLAEVSDETIELMGYLYTGIAVPLLTKIAPAVYLSMFYFFNNPRSSILDNYLILLCVVYCVTGIAYALAIYFEPGQAQLWSVLLPVVLTLVASKDSAVTVIVGDYIYSKWALEAFIIANAKRTTTTMAIPSVIPQVGHGKDRVYTNPYPYLVQVERLFPVDHSTLGCG